MAIVQHFFFVCQLPLVLAEKQRDCAGMAGDVVGKIIATGLACHRLSLTRGGRSLLQELLAFPEIYKLFRQLKPDAVITLINFRLNGLFTLIRIGPKFIIEAIRLINCPPIMGKVEYYWARL